ncbi:MULTISPECIES: alpha-hydroxy acid oxidase [unclassified Marinobacterium]|uniref:alpha-hydroxy acid oxidase n=1 Tax=unclassified Marinobacterium TaxID=2644139 RepID=UPI0015698EE1|nr:MULTISPECIES: alpha-hydroxy acid oxidase [unclassified Marinobacterium]NRP11014.1 L-lactate dehydrogenase [cytochrome] [Marinobacterium sp. xm-g-48]NRP83858.1 L-lactate dehydrogenase [cytochrome] [Marinobacterium sp. xm-d-509]
MSVICELSDLRRLYHKRVPKMFQGYCESGSWTQQTLAMNDSDFNKILFRQRVARDLAPRTLATQMVGQDVTMPVAMAPVGLLGMQHADGEIKAAQAAEAFGVPFTLSTMSICSIEKVAEATTKPFWFQLYVQKDREFTKKLIERAKAAGCSALVVTLDLQMIGKRHADHRNGMTAPPRLTIPNILDISRRPRWAFGMLGTKNREFGNIQGCATGVDDMNDLMKWTAGSFDPNLDWDDLKFFRELWDGPLIIKGILEAEDAKKCIELGADAIVVSNHGGRQLDGARSSISVLPEIVDAVGDQIEVWMDGGIRSGQDVIRARALGAKGVLVGRPMVYGLGAMGKAGVTRMLEIFHEEAELTMAFMGHRDIASVSKDDIVIKGEL